MRLGTFKDLVVRRATDTPELRAAFRLRYREYRHIGAIDHSAHESFEDAYDHRGNATVFLLYQGKEPIASIRTLTRSPEAMEKSLTASEVYGAALQSLGPDARMVESNRFVFDPLHQASVLDSAHFLLFKATVLIGYLAKADWYLGAARREHGSLYRRMFNMKPVTDYRSYPGLTIAMALHIADFPGSYAMVRRRFPALEITDEDEARWRARGEVLTGLREPSLV